MCNKDMFFARHCTTVIGLMFIDANMNRINGRVANRNRRRVANRNRGRFAEAA